MLALAGMGLYVFYPAPKTLIEDMTVIRVEAYDALRTEDATEFRRRTAQWKRQVEKLPTSILIRGGSISAAGQESITEFLYGLKTLDAHMTAGRMAEAKMMRSHVDRLYRTCCRECTVGAASTADEPTIGDGATNDQS